MTFDPFLEGAARDSKYQDAIALVNGSKRIEDLDHDPLAEFGGDRHKICVKPFLDGPSLWLADRIIVPTSLREGFMIGLHKAYFESKVVFRYLCKHYYWPGMWDALLVNLGNDCFNEQQES